jgi:hypothetical protein
MTAPGILVTCPREDCLHEWNYTGTAMWITCSKCRTLFKSPYWKPREKKERKS